MVEGALQATLSATLADVDGRPRLLWSVSSSAGGSDELLDVAVIEPDPAESEAA